MSALPHIAREEEAALLLSVRCRAEGAAEKLLHAYHPLICHAARRMAGYRAQAWRGDLVQAGSIGILRAADRFEPERGVRFATYAVPWMLGEMKRTMRAEFNHAGQYEPRRRLLAAKDLLCSELGRMPTLQELSAHTGMEPYEIALLMELTSMTVGFDEYRIRRQDAAPAGGGIDLDAISLRAAIETLDEEEQRLIGLRFFEDRTQCEAAEILGKSQSAVSKAEQRALLRLRSILKQDYGSSTAAREQRKHRSKA